MKIDFRRITTSGKYIPEIDGLRFVAIFSVVLYHILGFINEKYIYRFGRSVSPKYLRKELMLEQGNFIEDIISHGSIGVPLFFVISAFVLGLPFANYYLKKGERVNVKQYFLRRITRLEPPYIVVLTLLLIGGVFVAKTLNVAEGLKSYVASVFYVHNFVYPDELPKITGVAWSLEVEFKFYLLAPLMAFIFAVKSSKLRRIILVGLSLGFIAISHIFVLPLKSILYYFQYFLIGFLLVDFYVTGDVLFPKKSYDKVIALIAFSLIFLISYHGFSLQSIVLSSLRCVGIFVFYYYVILNKSFDFLSNKVVTTIGGMCYSIYLLHYAVISFFGNPILRLNFTSSLMVNKVLIAFILIALILLVSAVFYLLVERPCMKKDWYKNILSSRVDKIE